MLPSSRNTTYAPGSQVKSADLNDMQDLLVDLHAPAPRKIAACAGQAEGGSFADGVWTAGASGTQLIVPIIVNAGERITSINIIMRGDASQTLDCALFQQTGVATGPPISDTESSAASLSNQTLTINTASGNPLAVDIANDDTVYQLRCRASGSAGGVGVQVGGVSVTVSRP